MKTAKRHAQEGEEILIVKTLYPGGNGYFEVGDVCEALEVESNGDVLVAKDRSHGSTTWIYAVAEEYEVIIGEETEQ